MAKKKEENKDLLLEDKIVQLETKLEAQDQILENFRISFQNIDTKIKNLIERNRLR